jgi:hypothetical protein
MRRKNLVDKLPINGDELLKVSYLGELPSSLMTLKFILTFISVAMTTFNEFSGTF